ncbi:MAG: ABC transporter substrate-binding protein [Actinomycetota bacterium]|nr:ABC transporter substrate-binding protein [Actinomycetota bacterium]
MLHSQRGRSVVALVAVSSFAGLGLAACGSSSGGSSSNASGPPSGTILVLTNRTDIVNTELPAYAKEFNKIYPKVTVKFQALSDYAGDVKTRMSTKNYGDVLLVPTDIPPAQLATFFEPLGTTAEMGKKYRFADAIANAGKVYGLATFGDANGIVYNKKIFKQAGITSEPTTPGQLITDLKAVKAKTAATPYYTNYKDGWPLAWPAGTMGAVSGDVNANVKMASNPTPWAAGSEMNTLDNLQYTMVKQGLTEKDPTTTNWETSKSLLATGKIAMMPLGSWALPQMQLASKTAGTDPADVGFMPMPFQTNGKSNVPIGPDWTQGVSVHSSNKKAAMAWVTWFTDKSGYYKPNGGVPTLKSLPLPDSLTSLKGANILQMVPSPKSTAVDKQSEIAITQPDPYRKLVDSARGASGTTEQQLFDQWNKAWGAAIKSVG